MERAYEGKLGRETPIHHSHAKFAPIHPQIHAVAPAK
jgi:hypothetical protein